MRVVALLIVLMVTLSGCITRVLDISGTEWRRPSATIQQITYDETECARASEFDGNLPDTYVGGLADLVVLILEEKLRGSSYDRCMTSRGYERVAGPVRP